MHTNYLIKNICFVNEGERRYADILIKNEIIEKIGSNIDTKFRVEEIDGSALILMPGVIDDQVHFREPGLTHKADIYSESKAAVAGGITSFMEMPNTIPPTLTLSLLEEKYNIASKNSLVNYSFYLGASETNIEVIKQANKLKDKICGVKIFMGSSTGNLLVESPVVLEEIFSQTNLLIATHCEDEQIIQHNKLQHLNKQLFAQHHPIIRDENACYQSSLKAIQIATKYNTRLHILHISTAKELSLFGNLLSLEDKKITAEVCVHHLHFTDQDYAQFGNLIKCNPAIKSSNNKDALWLALLDDRLDVIATDHAPHTFEEKQLPYINAPAGIPLIQHSLLLMLYYESMGKISLEKIVQKMSHNVAIAFNIKNRGYIREGYYADLVLINKNNYTINKQNIIYKSGWSPLENVQIPYTIDKTFVNGNLVFNNNQIKEETRGKRLEFKIN